MIQLNNFLNKIEDNKVIFALEEILDEKKVSITASWCGYMISIEGCEGSALLDDLAIRYLKIPLKIELGRDRVTFPEEKNDRIMWEKLRKLYREAEATNTCLFTCLYPFYKYLNQMLFDQMDPKTILNTKNCKEWREQQTIRLFLFPDA